MLCCMCCTGLDINKELLSSGNPTAWDIEKGSRSREVIVLVHKTGYDAEHWAVRIDRATQRITHVSAGPILRTVDFQPEVGRCCSTTVLWAPFGP